RGLALEGTTPWTWRALALIPPRLLAAGRREAARPARRFGPVGRRAVDLQRADLACPAHRLLGVAPVQHQEVLQGGHAVLPGLDAPREPRGEVAVAGEEPLVQPPGLLAGRVAEVEFDVGPARAGEGRVQPVDVVGGH